MENQEGILLKSSTQIFKSDWRVTEKAREMKNIYYPKIIALRMKEPLNKYVENKQRLQKTLSLWNFLVCVCSSKLFSVIVFEEAGYLSLSNLPWEFVSLSCVGCSALLCSALLLLLLLLVLSLPSHSIYLALDGPAW